MTGGRIAGLGLVIIAATVIARGQSVKPMAVDAKPSFEVATIKLSDPALRGHGINTHGSRIGAQGETLKSLLLFAYGVHGNQIVGGPAWIGEDKYDISGIADATGEPSLKQMQEMFQKLLVQRFGLVFHADKRELSYYAIVVAKGGPKLEESKVGPEVRPDQNGNGDGKQMSMKFTNNSMSDFRLGMQYFTDKPVVDETGLSGRYDFGLKWSTEDLRGEESNGPPGMFTAIQEQLGLRLEAKKGPVEVMILDQVTRPSAN